MVVQRQQVVEAPSASSYAETFNLIDRAEIGNAGSYYAGNGLFFDSPTNNIGCYLYDSGYVACSITTYDFPQPGPDCDAGIGVLLDYDASLTSCSGYFHVAHDGTVLPYGTALIDGDFRCVSESDAVYCINTSAGTGFSLSRQAFTLLN